MKQFVAVAIAHFLALLIPGVDFFLIVRTEITSGWCDATGACPWAAWGESCPGYPRSLAASSSLSARQRSCTWQPTSTSNKGNNPVSTPHQKTVIIVGKNLPTGLAVNAAAIVAAMMTTAIPELMGPPVRTADGELPSVILAPLPVLAGDADLLRTLWERTCDPESGLTAFPFTKLAQSCKTYQDYTDKVASSPTRELELAALGIAGPKKAINSLTGDTPLYPPRKK